MTQDGRTVYRLSLDSGVSQGVLGRFLRGNRDVTLETADKICKALGLSLQPVKKGARVTWQASTRRPRAPRSGTFVLNPEPNVRKVVKGCADYKATEALARKLETEAFNHRRGIIDERADRAAKQQARPLADQVADFQRHMQDKGDTEAHAAKTARRVRQILEGIQAASWSHITLDRVQGWLADRQQQDKGPQQADEKKARTFGASTRNHYTRAIKHFCRWLLKDNRASYDPLIGLGTVNADVDVRVNRRVLNLKDLQALLTKTAKRPELCGLTGPERVLVYRLALTTGLRAGEIASLTVGDFRLADGVVEVQAAYAKNRRRDELPLRADLLGMLTGHLRGRQAAEPAFPAMPDSDLTAEMLKADLHAAGLKYEAPEGRYDFHSLRHQFCSDLVASGANIKVCQTLARHSTPVLTIGRYSHTRIHDRQAAVENLPDLNAPTTEPEQQQATGTDGAVAPAVASDWVDGATSDQSGHMATGASAEDVRTEKAQQNAEKQAVGHNLATSDNAAQIIGVGGESNPHDLSVRGF